MGGGGQRGEEKRGRLDPDLPFLFGVLMSSGEDDDKRSVNDLRWQLDELNLDVDGSREILIARLDHANEEEPEEERNEGATE